jgi:hypothetical protein
VRTLVVMHANAGGEQRTGLRRLRWRLRGALLWPAFVVVTLLEVPLLHWLPLAGDGTGLLAALLLAGCLNVIAVALVGGLGGVALRRRRPDLPKVVADDRAGVAALALVAIVFVAVGLVHRPEIADERAAFAQQSAAVHRWVEANGDGFARGHVNAATTLRIEADLYRTCVPGRDPRRWLCLIVDTSVSPPSIRRDPNRESNASWSARGSFR